MINSRFAVAVHILALLAIENRCEPTTSEYLAYSASTNPVVIRRILSALRKAGLVTAQPGVGGGASLKRRPEDITLLEVYEAIGEREVFSLGSRQPNPYCVCGRNIQPVLADVFCEVGRAVEGTLAGMTVAQVAREIEQRDAGG